MRLRTLTVLMVLAMAGAAKTPAQIAPNTPAGFSVEIMIQFESSMEKFIALAKAMPADKFSWSPGPGVMPVAKVYAHVARYNYLYPATSLGAPAPDGRDSDQAEDLADKNQLVARLEESAAHVRAVIEGLPDPGRATRQYGRDVPQWSVLLQLVAHLNEHLGQSIAYARMNGVVPPWSR
jgi:uncharacterized damage-inducible protein DinB